MRSRGCLMLAPALSVPHKKPGHVLGDSCVPGHVPSLAVGISGFACGASSIQTYFAISGEELISEEPGIPQRH